MEWLLWGVEGVRLGKRDKRVSVWDSEEVEFSKGIPWSSHEKMASMSEPNITVIRKVNASWGWSKGRQCGWGIWLGLTRGERQK